MREIPGFEGYKIDENSNVYSIFIKRFMKQKIQSNGYKVVGLCKDKKYHYLGCHRLAAMSYLGLPEGYKDLHVCHFDGDKNNNHISNLRWATPTENNNDKYRHGTAFNCKKGIDHHGAKLTEDIVINLRKSAVKMDCKDMSIKFGISKMTVYDAVVGKTWKSINSKCPPVSLKGRQRKGNQNAIS